MDVFINRNPTGCETFDLEDLNELEEQLKSFDALKPLDDKAEIHVEITGTWGEIRELLSQPCFKDIWFRPKIVCAGCGAIGEGTPENLPPGWKIRRHRGGHDYRCPNCQKK